jgi:hypothetical protein
LALATAASANECRAAAKEEATMEPKPSAKTDRCKMLCDLVVSATGAKAQFDVWWTQVSDAATPFSDKMDEHSAFFRASRDAHYMSFFIYLGQLFDSRNDASSLKNYEKLLKNEAPTKTYRTFKSRFREFEKRGALIRKIRNTRVAHVNARVSETDVFAELDMTWNEIRNLIYDVAGFVAELHPDQAGIPPDGHLGKATLRLLRALR